MGVVSGESRSISKDFRELLFSLGSASLIPWNSKEPRGDDEGLLESALLKLPPSLPFEGAGGDADLFEADLEVGTLLLLPLRSRGGVEGLDDDGDLGVPMDTPPSIDFMSDGMGTWCTTLTDCHSVGCMSRYSEGDGGRQQPG